jgi:beta-phosphoglucomutase
MDSLNILLEIGGKSFDETTKLTLAEKKNNWYVEYIATMDESEVLPGVRAFMNALKEKNIKIALGSVSKNAMTILNRINLIEYFDSIIDGTKVSNAKPDPEVFLNAAKELTVLPVECVVFEDAVAGIEAAINAGMPSVGIGSPAILTRANKVVPGFDGLTLDILKF